MVLWCCNFIHALVLNFSILYLPPSRKVFVAVVGICAESVQRNAPPNKVIVRTCTQCTFLITEVAAKFIRLLLTRAAGIWKRTRTWEGLEWMFNVAFYASEDRLVMGRFQFRVHWNSASLHRLTSNENNINILQNQFHFNETESREFVETRFSN